MYQKIRVSMAETGKSGGLMGVIESRRKELGIHKGKLAVKLNLSRKQFKRIEQGKFTLSELEGILKALNLTILILPNEHINTI